MSVKPTTLLVLVWLVVTIPAQGQSPPIDLSPAGWPEGELERYADLTYHQDLPRPRGVGRRAIIAGTSSALAVRSGLEALKQGGTAADAAVATAMAQIVLTAGCCMSFAGDYMITYYEAATGETHYLDASMATVLGEDDPLSIPPRGTPSGRSALVPGFMAGVAATHSRFGRLPWATLLQPSIYFAQEGFTLDPFLESAIAYREDVLTRRPATRKIFTSPDGDLYKAGELFRQPRLARTLRRWAKRGAGDMYDGVWARKFVRAVRGEGGKMTRSDLRRYEPVWGDVVRLRYRDHDIHLPGAPATGGGYIRTILSRIAPHDMAGDGHYRRSADSLYHLARAIREFWLGEVVTAERVSEHTDSVVVVDEEGNVAAAQYSIYTRLWGTTGIFVEGVSVGDTAAANPQEILETGPGNLLPNPGNTLIAFRDGRPALATASIGSGLIGVTAQVLVDLIDYGFDPKRAQKSPTVRRPDFTLPDDPVRVTAGRFADDLLDAVRAMGVPIVEERRGEEGAVGFWCGLVIQPGGRMVAATSNALNGWAEGY